MAKTAPRKKAVTTRKPKPRAPRLPVAKAFDVPVVIGPAEPAEPVEPILPDSLEARATDIANGIEAAFPGLEKAKKLSSFRTLDWNGRLTYVCDAANPKPVKEIIEDFANDLRRLDLPKSFCTMPYPGGPSKECLLAWSKGGTVVVRGRICEGQQQFSVLCH